MKAFLFVAAIALSGCMSVFPVELGMSEKSWLRTTLVGDLALKEANITAYKSSGAYYYFRDGILVKVDKRLLTAKEVMAVPAPNGTAAAQR